MSVNLDNLGNLNHHLSRNFNPQIRDDWVKKIAESLPTNTKILDVSSGNQPYKHMFDHCQYFSHEFGGNEEICDYFRGETSKDKKKYDYISNITDIPVQDNEFDCVLCTEVFEHIPEPIKAMKELVRICRPGGKIIVTAPFTSGSHQQPYHFYSGFSPEFYEFLATKFGLKIKEITSQGDFFKLMCYFTNTALYFAMPGADISTLQQVRHYLESYYLTCSEVYGNTADVGKHFTVGWMVMFEKTELKPPQK
jgi:2-polyprenyl-3-methyl-5-hydroxy-6-metoxy-1,4-benzoquinol methylase